MRKLADQDYLDVRIGFPKEAISFFLLGCSAVTNVKTGIMYLHFTGFAENDTLEVEDILTGHKFTQTFWDYLFSILEHETLHYVLYKRISFEACSKLDMISKFIS